MKIKLSSTKSSNISKYLHILDFNIESIKILTYEEEFGSTVIYLEIDPIDILKFAKLLKTNIIIQEPSEFTQDYELYVEIYDTYRE